MKKQSIIAAVILNTDKQLLVMHHNKINKITIPLGKIEANEISTTTLRRELFEELDIKTSEFSQMYIYSVIMPDYNKVVEVHLFRVTKYTGTIINKEPTKHKYLHWVNKYELDKLRENGEIDSILAQAMSFNLFG